ncbi:MAG: hypothetical protein ABJ205_09020 [Erythrobacter sp.]|uniref:hypothetical protein n=1 Tax=Erythrobacter sp. TaxID=1042 RepID=UPI003267BFA7
MNAHNPELANPHSFARDEIDAWRGRCIDLCARGERAVSKTLQEALKCDHLVKLSPMAGPRLREAQTLFDTMSGTEKQHKAAAKTIKDWCDIEPKRAFLAHGELTTLLDPRSNWHARFDLTRFKANAPIEESWVLDRQEAHMFEEELQHSFASLSQQLGQLRRSVDRLA